MSKITLHLNHYYQTRKNGYIVKIVDVGTGDISDYVKGLYINCPSSKFSYWIQYSGEHHPALNAPNNLYDLVTEIKNNNLIGLIL